jgi:hypothetical protein
MQKGTCPLCKTAFLELQDSHILPKGLYKGMRKRAEAVTQKTGGNPNPALIFPGGFVQSSEQRRCYMLCRPCEQLLSRKGERWTLGQLLQADGSFPLKDRVLSRPPVTGDPPDGMMIYSTNGLSVDHASLTHFAVGIIWKMLQYGRIKGEGNVRLGAKYEEILRRFLLGQAEFPQEAFLLLTFTTGSLTDAALPPYTFKSGLAFQHRLVVPGLAFTLMIGRDVPTSSYEACFAHNKEHPITTSRAVNNMILTVFRLVYGSTQQ